MKVIKQEEDRIEFDNGLAIEGVGDIDCCANNYIDFEQFPVGTEFPDMTVGQLVDSMTVKEDGFALTDSQGTPKWAQARSDQNGYYSSMTDLFVVDGKKRIQLARLDGEVSGY